MHGCTSSSMESCFTEAIGQAGGHMTWISPRRAASAPESQRDADTAHSIVNPPLEKTFNLHHIYKTHIKETHGNVVTAVGHHLRRDNTCLSRLKDCGPIRYLITETHVC